MDESPIPTAAAPDSPPSDMPPSPPTYPGKPLTHRFLPIEQIRQVIENKFGNQNKLATENPLNPVVTVSYPDKNIHLGPVSNVRSRGIQPVALEGQVNLPISGSNPVDLSDELRGPLQTRVDKLNQPWGATQETSNQLPSVSPFPITNIRPLESVRTELEKVKEVAKAELEKRRGAPFFQTGQVSSPSLSTPPTTQSNSETKHLLSEAEKLETELIKLREDISGRRQEPQPQPPTPTVADPHLVIIEQLTTENEALQKKLAQLSENSDQSSQKQKGLETRLEATTADFSRQIQQMRIEKTNLVDQFKKLEDKISVLPQKEYLIEQQAAEITKLRADLKAIEGERDSATSHLKKLETFLDDLRKKPTQEPESAPVVKPSVVETEKQPQPSARIIRPQVAIGKMAPALTSAPNVINGIVKDANGLLLSNVIIVVKDENNEPVRALKTNKIGQFAISTPLPNGVYNMELEGDNHSFDIIQVDVKGKVMPPVEIRANS